MRRKKMESLPEELPGENKEDSMLDAIMLRQALHDLDSEERELILLRYVNEVPVADMAKIYGKSRYALYRETKKFCRN